MLAGHICDHQLDTFVTIYLWECVIIHDVMELKETIAKRLKEIRIKNNLSQADVAKELNITQAAVARYETGEHMPSVDALKWYSDRFNVSLDYLFGKSDNPKGSANYDFATPGTDANKLLKEVVKIVVDEYKKK